MNDSTAFLRASSGHSHCRCILRQSGGVKRPIIYSIRVLLAFCGWSRIFWDATSIVKPKSEIFMRSRFFDSNEFESLKTKGNKKFGAPNKLALV
jgi:hypothetical protein